MSSEQDVKLLGLVLSKFALAETASLTTLLSKYLLPIIYKLSSPHKATRGKVFEVLSHVNQLVSPEKSVRLDCN
jgi:proteasome component ECM29